ncbi:Acyl transferase/acyl hydrolase/lysophospholipase [Metarhizium album ARSEF 1941]|uniref:Patatin-like phospholipase domain-containing protein n=1 Tax=Metarhizium album (strain ARSEF 1941) TaxID=1081103 RepID=A0A0B2WR77_METAS|nr:Acyl transferase/acyl hydrolase/lysophospholipase [Metarhizium album ARSEF 1941]KHN95480.1 Acyl transferase/acyl hydrolase/lysophospholipase [Metarhizium album ARSEF 1941]
MADLILQAHRPPSLHAPAAYAGSRSEPKTQALLSQQASGRGGRLRKVVSRTLRDANDALLSWKDGLTVDERERLRLQQETKAILSAHMKSAETYARWKEAAAELDTLEGNDGWKNETVSDEYDFLLIQERLRALDDARLGNDIRSMMHLIRTELSRDLGGMGSVDLYRHSHTGTKKLIERYVESAIETIDAIVTQSALNHRTIQVKDLLEGMLFSRQSFGRSALLLSGGGTFGMTHIGVLKALFEQQLLPRIISGASAGSIVCAVMCTKTDEEIPELLRDFPYGDLAVFESEDSNLGVLGHMRRLLTEGSWSNIDNLTRVMRNLTRDMTFQEAYNRTRRILNICVSTASIYELPRLLNYVTAPNVMIWSAVAASCSLPLVYTSSPLLVKDPVSGEHHPWTPTPQRFIDGSVDNDLPMTRLAEMFNVNHFIVCQVNPHVVPFLSRDDVLPQDNRPTAPAPNARRSDDVDWTYALTTLARDEALHRLQFMAELGIFPNLMTKCRTILSQKYSGDITILPEIAMHDLPKLLSNPTVDFMLRSCVLGERATWPRLSRIRDRCAIELCLDRAVHRLRTRVVFSDSQRNLRELQSEMGQMRIDMTPTTASQSPAPVAGHSAAGAGTHQDPVRRRRRSGGSVQTMPGGGAALDMGITHDETAAEKCDELLSRSHSAHPSTSQRKPRLKRSCKSQVNVPQHREPATTATPAALAKLEFRAVAEFNPLRPMRTAGGTSSQALPSTSRSPDVRPIALGMWSERVGGLSREEATSPTDDVETSELDRSSDADADAEQATEESDPDPYDASVRSGPTKKTRR